MMCRIDSGGLLAPVRSHLWLALPLCLVASLWLPVAAWAGNPSEARIGDLREADTSTTPVMIIAPARQEGTVNINQATPEDLTRHLKGVGPVKARAIVAYREQYGKFRTVSELADVKGIGPKTVERLRPLIRLE
jgi:competence protein ComEA